MPTKQPRVSPCLIAAALPILVAVYPALFHFSNNAGLALWSDLWRLSLVFFGVAIIIYALACVLVRGSPVQAGIAAAVFMVFFHTYGIAFRQLRALDAVRIEHFTLLPVYILLGIQVTFLTARLASRRSIDVWRAGVAILGVLIAYNSIRITAFQLPSTPSKTNGLSAVSTPPRLTPDQYPDIYFLVFDEMAGFEAMRQYWHTNSVDAFAAFLESHGFYVAEQSHGNSISTPHLLAQRLNFEVYPPPDKSKIRQYEQASSNARIFQYMSSLGYTTVGFDESRSAFGFPAGPALAVKYLYENPSGAAATPRLTDLDDFMLMVAGNTMLRPVTDRGGSVPDVDSVGGQITFLPDHARMVSFTMRKIPALHDVPSPKFVYMHLMLPHFPFTFKADGSLVLPSGRGDWSNYLGNYQYTMVLIEGLVSDILTAADAEHLPVIIIQSDHGARNNDYGKGVMADYPNEYKTLIVNAMRLPGCDQSALTQDMNPINTLPIVLNCYFDAAIPLVP
jgi:hypothetical protein